MNFELNITTYILMGVIVIILVVLLVVIRKMRKLKEEVDSIPAPENLPPPTWQPEKEEPPIIKEPPKELPTPPKPKKQKIETAIHVEFSYENQLELDIQRVRTEMEMIKNNVKSMKTTYQELEAKLAKLEQVRGMLK